MKNRITVVGSLNIDMVVQAPRTPRPGETIKGHTFHTIPGGKGANQAVAAARQGAAVTLVGSVGNDDFGRMQQAWLRRDGIDLTYLTVDSSHATGIAFITVDDSGQNSIVVIPGANGGVTRAQIDSARETICTADIMVCQLEIPLDAVTRTIELANAHRVPVILNPAPAYPVDASILQRVTYLIPNEIEAGLLTGIEVHDPDTARKAAAHLQQLGVQTVILTLGGKGVLVAHNDEMHHETALVVDAVDTTAAGDAFVGSFAVALTEGKSVFEAVRFANHVAALSVTKLGAQSSLPTRVEVEQFIKSHH